MTRFLLTLILLQFFVSNQLFSEDEIDVKIKLLKDAYCQGKELKISVTIENKSGLSFVYLPHRSYPYLQEVKLPCEEKLADNELEKVITIGGDITGPITSVMINKDYFDEKGTHRGITVFQTADEYEVIETKAKKTFISTCFIPNKYPYGKAKAFFKLVDKEKKELHVPFEFIIAEKKDAAKKVTEQDEQKSKSNSPVSNPVK